MRAVDNKGKTSSPASYTWVIDATAPSVASITRVGANPTNAASVVVDGDFQRGRLRASTLGDFALAKVGLATAALTGVTRLGRRVHGELVDRVG